MMKLKHVCYGALGLLFAACSSNEPGADEPQLPAAPQPVEQQTVAFTNNTTMTIGSRMAGAAKARGTKPSVRDNAACDLEMPDCPQLPSEYINLANPPATFQPWTLGLAGSADTNWQPVLKDLYVPAGATFAIDGARIQKDIFVDGTLVINNYDSGASVGAIYVRPGGKLEYKASTPVGGITVVNYGELATGNSLYINRGAKVFTATDLKLDALQVGGVLFVGGTLDTGVLTPYADAMIHVDGDMLLSSNNAFHNFASICVEGSMVTADISLNTAFDLHAACKVMVNGCLELHNDANISTGYIASQSARFSAGKIILDDGGVAALGELTIGDVSSLYVGTSGTSALLSCTDLLLKEGYSLEGCFDADLWLNFNGFYVYVNGAMEKVANVPGLTADGCHEVNPGTTHINAAKLNAYTPGGCNPGFEIPTSPEPEPEPTPGLKDEIVIEILDEIKKEYVIDADDFAIRIDGAYQPGLNIKDNVASLEGVVVSEAGMAVTVGELQNLAPGHEYTYEVWLWVREESWRSFSEAEKRAWVGGDGFGTDITSRCRLKMPLEGYKVNYNVYCGLSGQADTPYIKVSVHVTKE